MSQDANVHREQFRVKARAVGYAQRHQLFRMRGKKYFANIDVRSPDSQTNFSTLQCQIYSGTTCNVTPTTHLPQIGNPEVLPSSPTMVMYDNNEVKHMGGLPGMSEKRTYTYIGVSTNFRKIVQ